MGKLVHYYKTIKWALEVGFSKEEAREIANANWQVDMLKPGEQYERGRHLNTNLLSIFNGMPTQLWYASYHFSRATKANSLSELGRALHSIQDWVGHGEWPLFGYHWKGPWRVGLFGRKFRLRRYDPDSDFSGDRLEQLERVTKEYMRDYLRKAVGEQN